MFQTVIGTLEKRLETEVSVVEDFVNIRQEDTEADQADFVQIKYADLDAFIKLLVQARAAIDNNRGSK